VISYARIDRELQAFITNSGVHPDETMATLTLDAARDTIPRLLDVACAVRTERATPVQSIADFDHPASGLLGEVLAACGSDKSTNHDYHRLYAHILGPRCDEPLHVFEVGLGSNNTDVVGAMGSDAKVGASLRAWRSFLPRAQVFGADIDRRILFEEDRIKTFYVDQTSPATFETIDVPPLDLLIDDGLHCTHTNLATLAWGLTKLAPRGWIVIEDIRASSLDVWHLAARLLSPVRYRSILIDARWGYLFAVEALP
jgi:hypothetical protein